MFREEQGKDSVRKLNKVNSMQYCVYFCVEAVCVCLF